jgi:hypothetical protein
MSAPSQHELRKFRKAAVESIIISNEMKQAAVEERLRTLASAVKRQLAKKDAQIEIFVMKGTD